jgi:hypothetical protein
MIRERNIQIRTRALQTILFTVTLAGCGAEEQPGAGKISYWQDVAPILNDRCVSCHQAGGVGPFRLDSYTAAMVRSPAVVVAVKERRMPPWLAKGDGTCGDFQDSRWLSEAEIQTLARWAEGGFFEGTPRDDLRLPDPPALTEAVEVSSPPYRPEPLGTSRAHADDYRCFLVDPALTADNYLTGYEVVPGTPAMIHHVLLMQVDGDKASMSGRPNREVIRSLDESSPDREGWPCYGLAGEGVDVAGIPITWAPGMGVVRYPARTGVRISPTTMLVMQVHYNLSQTSLRGREDTTKIRLRFEPLVERTGVFDLADNFLRTITTPTPATLAPGQKRVDYTWEIAYDREMTALRVPFLELYGIFPHMHGFGRTERVEVIKPGQSSTCAADVPAWNFDWQLYYFYRQPIRVEPGDKIRVTCSFDTSSRTEPVLPGWGTENEMCMAGVYLVPPAK